MPKSVALLQSEVGIEVKGRGEGKGGSMAAQTGGPIPSSPLSLATVLQPEAVSPAHCCLRALMELLLRTEVVATSMMQLHVPSHMVWRGGERKREQSMAAWADGFVPSSSLSPPAMLQPHNRCQPGLPVHPCGAATEVRNNLDTRGTDV